MKHHAKNQSLWRKLGFATSGILYAVQQEHNMQRHLIVSLLVIVLFAWLEVSTIWWALITLAIGLVIAGELANSAIEALIDHLHPEIHDSIKHAKDMLAGMVLILSIMAGVIGVLAVLSKLW